MIKGTQLYLPGWEEDPRIFFNEERCEKSDCHQPAKLLAIYFTMGMYNDDDNVPHLVGYDCPFDDSPTLYACTKSHLESLIINSYTGEKKGIEEAVAPDIIVNAQGIVLADFYAATLGLLGIPSDPHFLTEKTYSFGKESLEQLWVREKWRWISERI